MFDPEVSVTASCPALSQLMACFSAQLCNTLICVPRLSELSPEIFATSPHHHPSADATNGAVREKYFSSGGASRGRRRPGGRRRVEQSLELSRRETQ